MTLLKSTVTPVLSTLSVFTAHTKGPGAMEPTEDVYPTQVSSVSKSCRRVLPFLLQWSNESLAPKLLNSLAILFHAVQL